MRRARRVQWNEFGVLKNKTFSERGLSKLSVPKHPSHIPLSVRKFSSLAVCVCVCVRSIQMVITYFLSSRPDEHTVVTEADRADNGTFPPPPTHGEGRGEMNELWEEVLSWVSIFLIGRSQRILSHLFGQRRDCLWKRPGHLSLSSLVVTRRFAPWTSRTTRREG